MPVPDLHHNHGAGRLIELFVKSESNSQTRSCAFQSPRRIHACAAALHLDRPKNPHLPVDHGYGSTASAGGVPVTSSQGG